LTPLVADAAEGQPRSFDEEYADWISRYDSLGDDDREAIAVGLRGMANPPLISVIMPVYETPEPYLRAAIESVRQQLYPNWELCIADNASPSPHVRQVLEEFRRTDPRIKICYRSENGHISASSNSALGLAEGQFVALVDSDDILPEHALYVVAASIAAQPDLDLIYSDEDKITIEGRRFDPYFKPDWSPDLLLSQNVFSHLGVYRRRLVEEVGGFRLGYEGSQDYDLVLRASIRTSPDRILHLPYILYHWRAIPSSTAFNADAKPYALQAARKAIADHLAKFGLIADVLPSRHPAFHRVLRAARPAATSYRHHPDPRPGRSFAYLY
jgi:O-antigen biosynthesis protein